MRATPMWVVLLGGARLFFFLLLVVFMEAVKQAERRRAAAPADGDGAPRRPLAPSEKNNAAPAGRRREGPSRFKPVAPPAAPTPAPAAPAARRCSSPSPGRASTADGSATAMYNNRARSADRARPATPSSAPSSRLKPSTAGRSATPPRDAAADVHSTPHPRARNASKASDGLWASASARSPSPCLLRSRSEPVQSPASKVDRLVHGLPTEQVVQLRSGAVAAERKRIPHRGKGSSNNIGDQCENARPSTSSSVVEKHRWPGMTMTSPARRGSAGAGLTSTCAVLSSDASAAGRSPRRTTHPSEGTAGKSLLKRVSNEMAKIVHRRRKDKPDSCGSDTSSQTSESSKSTCRRTKAAVSSPVPVLHRSPSPRQQGLSSAASSSFSRSCQSPSRMRPCQSICASAAAQSVVEQPVFNYIVDDARKGKKNAGQIENIHQLRVLSNRYLQWRFVNARSEETLSHKNSVESILYSVWKNVLTLRDALTITRTNVRHLKQELKLYDILTEQVGYLEQWPEVEEQCNDTLVEATEALQATTLRLPVTSGAQADGIAVRNAISSAVDVMQALSSSIYCVQSKVEDRTSLVSELSVMARQEKVALDKCRDLLAEAAKLQVQETSLRTLLMQLRQRSAG